MRWMGVGVALLIAALMAPASPASGASEIARDGFARTVVSGWGSADAGGGWTPAGPTASFSVAGGVGRLVANAVGATRSEMLAAVQVRDVVLTAQVRTSKLAVGGAEFAYLVVRQTTGVPGELSVPGAGRGSAGLVVELVPAFATLNQ